MRRCRPELRPNLLRNGRRLDFSSLLPWDPASRQAEKFTRCTLFNPGQGTLFRIGGLVLMQMLIARYSDAGTEPKLGCGFKSPQQRRMSWALEEVRYCRCWGFRCRSSLF